MIKIERFRRRLMLIPAMFLVLFATADAAVLTVTKTADTNDGVCDADCSLREAVGAAAASGDAIVFGPLFNAAQTIALGGTQLSIAKSLSVNGPGPALLTVSGGGLSRVFLIGSGQTVTLSGLRIAGGKTTNDDGAGVKNNGGNLTLANVVVTGNTAAATGFSLARGGGVANASLGGTVTIINSTVSGNSVTGGSGNNAFGGGVFNQSGTLNGNFNVVVITNSLIAGNSSTNSGGGIDNEGSLTITNSTVSGNQNTAPDGLNGGGMYVSTGGATTVTGTTFSGNSSNNAGGGLHIAQGDVTVTNSTFSGNTAVFGGGGIEKPAASVLTLTNVTVTGNTATNGAATGGGLRTANGTVNTRNGIFAGNSSNTRPDVSGTVVSQGYNLVGVSTGATGFTGPGDILDPAGGARLSPLGNFGGPTLTHAPLLNNTPALNSPAIDAADPLNPPAADQRGVARPQDGDNNGSARADIGAFELAAAASNYTAALPSVNVNQPYSLTIAVDTVQNGVTFTYCLSNGALPPGLSGINSCFAPVTEPEDGFSPAAAVVVSGTPTQGGTYNFTVRAADPAGNFTQTQYMLNVLAPTAAPVSIGGRVATAAGSGIRSARVTLTDAAGTVRTAFTGTFGFYRFDELTPGETYVLSVAARRFTFTPGTRVYTVFENAADADFIADDGIGAAASRQSNSSKEKKQ
ncbi:MAG: CSLREA domain-containing protein [Acidobacteria bacterium]|nr:CSLREA domain-containing protein [Acidobacteriota bacterium]